MKKGMISVVQSLLLAAGFALAAAPAAFGDPGQPNGPNGPNGPPEGLECPEGQNIVVHLKRHINDLQGAQVAIRLATVMESQVIAMPGNVEDLPVNVILFLTLQGSRLVDPANPQDLVFGSTPGTLGAVTEGFLAAGGTIYLCPICATEIGLVQGDELLYQEEFPGQVNIAGPPDIVKTFLCADKVLDF